MLKILGIEILLLRNINMIRGKYFNHETGETPKMWNKYVMILLNIVWLKIFLDYEK